MFREEIVALERFKALLTRYGGNLKFEGLDEEPRHRESMKSHRIKNCPKAERPRERRLTEVPGVSQTDGLGTVKNGADRLASSSRNVYHYPEPGPCRSTILR